MPGTRHFVTISHINRDGKRNTGVAAREMSVSGAIPLGMLSVAMAHSIGYTQSAFWGMQVYSHE
jgi:hypothetical protein